MATALCEHSDRDVLGDSDPWPAFQSDRFAASNGSFGGLGITNSSRSVFGSRLPFLRAQSVFPNRETIKPRLLYHRWFMLSETVYSEHAQTPSQREFERLNLSRLQQVKALNKGGRLVLARSLEATRKREEESYQRTLKRIDVLVRDIAQFLLDREGGEEIELTVATRTLPFPAEVRQGADLDDKRFLQYETNSVIGRFSKDDFAKDKISNEIDGEEVQP